MGKYNIPRQPASLRNKKWGTEKKSKKLCSSVEDQDLAPGFKVVSDPDLDPDPALTYLSDKFFFRNAVPRKYKNLIKKGISDESLLNLL